ncbi:MAG: carbohydrate-binding domain-containing protein [Eubacterium sp.]|nr:carbohydrate-binding domain-containing protein [Eubacterium sp.]
MKFKKTISILLAAVITATAFTACSKQEGKPAAESPSNVVEVTDADDGSKETVDTEDTTFEVTDKDGNVLTLIPIYHSDGTTIIAGYVEAAKDKDGKSLDEKSYAYLKQVIAVEADEEGNFSIKMADDKPVTLTALVDDKGNIIALQDALDLDNDKDVTEYFKATTTADSANNLFIRLDKDDKGNLVNVTVETKKEGNKTITQVKTNDGKTQTVNKSTETKNLNEYHPPKKPGETTTKKQDETTTKKPSDENPTKPSGGDDNPTTSNPDPDPTVDYTAIVLKKNGEIACDASNVTVSGSAATGGIEVVVEGAGEHSKYYVTSETDTFYGQMEFRFHIDEDVEVKFYDVTLNADKKTALKFTDADREKDKENDGEEIGTGGSIGSGVEVAAPKVELSFTGKNSFKANGSGKNGTIYSECKLAIKGHGSATIDGGQNLSGICSTESMSIKNATLNITSAAKQGISCDRKVTVNGGATININSKGDGIHCNKFLYNGYNTTDGKSTITINSLYTFDCADGIDTDDYIIINGGDLFITALSEYKYALKVRKVIKLNPKGQFEINGGLVEASGSNNSRLTSCSQSTVTVKGMQATTYTVNNYVSSGGAKAFICSPSGATVVKNASGQSINVEPDGNIRYADF